MKGMKKAYFRSIGANILEIPNCVRPFLKEMNKICGVNGLEGGDRNDSYAEPSDEKLSDFEKVLIIIKSAPQTEFVININVRFLSRRTVIVLESMIHILTYPIQNKSILSSIQT